MGGRIVTARVAVFGRIPASGLEVLHQVAEVWSWDDDEHIPDDVRNRELATAHAAVTLLTNKVDDAFLDAAPSLKIVANVAVGFNNIDVAACARRGVVVTNTPGVLADATADLAMALILMVTRRMAEGERLIRSGEPWAWGMFMMLGTGIQGRQLGIIGMGGIGEALAARARAFGMRVVYHNRRPVAPEVAAHLDAERLELEELLATSDVVSVNCPYNADTHHLIDAGALASMKSSAFLVNTARGPIVPDRALYRALKEGWIAGAALDDIEEEPAKIRDWQPESPLFQLDNVIVTPHAAYYSEESVRLVRTIAANEVVRVLTGQRPRSPVNVVDDAERDSA